ncbi:hypothetical protein C0991_009367 [Blastosporella zonata]|nr:hypothetical protein C0991_009367 [Blastosporella zonata]
MFSFRVGFKLLVGLVAINGVSAELFDAQGTYYEVDANVGACGQMHSNSEYVVALGHGIFDTYPGANTDDPNLNPICNKTLKATYDSKSVVVMVVDRCGGCPGTYDTDFSPTAFSALATQSEGRIDLKWEWSDLPLGPVVGDDSSSNQRRSKPFGRRKPLDPAPAQSIRRGISTSEPRAQVAGRRRRYLTEGERRASSGEMGGETSGRTG